MNNKCANTLRIIAKPTKLINIYECLKGVNSLTNKNELLCFKKFTNIPYFFAEQEKIKFAISLWGGLDFSYTQCERNVSKKYIEYFFNTEVFSPYRMIGTISEQISEAEFVLHSINIADNFFIVSRYKNGNLLAQREENLNGNNIQ
jgi:hypothetical protein